MNALKTFEVCNVQFTWYINLQQTRYWHVFRVFRVWCTHLNIILYAFAWVPDSLFKLVLMIMWNLLLKIVSQCQLLNDFTQRISLNNRITLLTKLFSVIFNPLLPLLVFDYTLRLPFHPHNPYISNYLIFKVGKYLIT